ncbi:hypothetical protein ACL02R_06950 [Streptomyces sp. MS19]|uniref:hypothetical protein n=1 Tax=Streptomyces sp. MS19 TaxID=3385972 RepID=UPI0039A0543B
MEPKDARTALDDIRHRREQSRAAYLRYATSPVSVLIPALILFGAFASYDLPNPWGGAVLFPALALLGALALHLRRAPVRRALTTRQAWLAAAAGTGLVAVFTALSSAARSGGVPAPHTVVSAVLCALGLLAAALVRRGVTGGGR